MRLKSNFFLQILCITLYIGKIQYFILFLKVWEIMYVILPWIHAVRYSQIKSDKILYRRFIDFVQLTV